MIPILSDLIPIKSSYCMFSYQPLCLQLSMNQEIQFLQTLKTNKIL